MTNELEKQFFDTFGIEPKDNFKGCENGITFYTYGCNIPSCKGCSKEMREKEYPPITDRTLLQLLEILLNFEYIGLKKGKDHYSIDFQGWLEQRESSLKNCILNALIVVANSEFKDVVYNDVQALFKGEICQ